MKFSKVLFSSLVTASILVSASCSSNVSMQPVSTEKAMETKVSNTELTSISDKEVAEINKLLSTEKLENKSFEIKDETNGREVDIDMLLMNPKAASRARFWGIKNANKLLKAGESPRKRWFLERKLGGLFPSEAFKVQVLVWVERADLLRINDISVDDSFLLVMAGVTSVPHLARYNNLIDQAALKVQLTLLAFQYGMPIPTTDEIRNWTDKATKLAPVIY